MKKILIIQFLFFLNNNICYCQLLNNPALTVKDFEVALSNPDHLRGILLEHNFKYERYFQYEEECVRAEGWDSGMRSESTPFGRFAVTTMFSISIYEYKPNLGPRPEVIISIDVPIYKNPIIANKLEMFLESIRSYYPERR